MGFQGLLFLMETASQYKELRIEMAKIYKDGLCGVDEIGTEPKPTGELSI